MINSGDSVENDTIKWLDTNVAVGFLVLYLILCLINVFMYYLLIQMVRRNDDLIVGKLLEYYAKFNIVFLPIQVVIVLGIVGLLPISSIAGVWFCDIAHVITYFGFYLNCNVSLMVTCLIYICVVHDDRANSFGKQRIRIFFCRLGFIIPLFMAILMIPLSRHPSSSDPPWINKCYGAYASRDDPLALCAFDYPYLLETYGNWSTLANIILQFLCWINFSISLITLTNIPEAILYGLIYWHLKR